MTHKPQWEIDFCKVRDDMSMYDDNNRIVDFIRSQKETSYQQGIEDMRRKCVEALEEWTPKKENSFGVHSLAMTLDDHKRNFSREITNLIKNVK